MNVLSALAERSGKKRPRGAWPMVSMFPPLSRDGAKVHFLSNNIVRMVSATGDIVAKPRKNLFVQGRAFMSFV